MDSSDVPPRPSVRPPRGLRSTPATSTPSRAASAGIAPRRNCLVSSGNGSFNYSSLRPSVVFSAAKLHITVGGCSAFYTAELSCMPDHPVTISPSNLPTSIRVTPSLQVFTKQNWSSPQYFRVAAIGGAVYDDAVGTNKDDRRIIQIIEHVSSSMDSRFNGNRLLYLPTTIVVNVTPRDGPCVFTCGRAIGTARHVSKTTANVTHHDFQQLDVETNGSGPRSTTPNTRGSVFLSGDIVARSSVVSSGHQTLGGAAAVAAVDAANLATQVAFNKRASARRSVVSSGSGEDVVAANEVVDEGLLHMPKDLHSFIRVACRKNQTVLLQRNGQIIVLGKRDVDMTNAHDKSEDPADSASDAALSKMLTDIDCGDDHIVAVTEHGYLLTWGEGSDGRLGHGSVGSRATPKLLKALLHKRIVHVACGARHTLALAEDGDVFAWGYGKSGALGLATSAQSKAAIESVPTPMEVLTLKQRGVAKISCGDHHSAVVLTNGALLTCGWTEHGRLGRGREVGGSEEYSGCFAPVELKGNLCTYVACGGAHTLALTACRKIFAFGCNSSGQLGLGDCRHRWIPTKVAYFDESNDDTYGFTVTSVAAGKLHSFATTQDARVFAWGSDEFGQCGVGTFPQIYTVPHLVPSTVGLGVTQVALGDSHSVVLGHTTQRHLDALEANHPARYALLMDRFESFVREDKARRNQVLGVAKQRRIEREAAVRQRKPPVDPSTSRGVEWQKQLEQARVAAEELVEKGSPVRSTPQGRPHTASSVTTASAMARSLKKNGGIVRPATGDAAARRAAVLTPASLTEDKRPKIRCSSATLWRQTRLFTFDPPAPDTTKSETVARANKNQLKLTTEAKQSLGRIFNDEADPTCPPEHHKIDSTQRVIDAALFSSTRPKSAPSRATRAS